MEIPVKSHGHDIYFVKVNVTPEEYANLVERRWYKLKGVPVSRGLGNLFNFISRLRKPGENFFPDLVPVIHKGVIVVYADTDDEDREDLKRHEWKLTAQGYAEFYNPVLKKFFLMHRYVTPEGFVVDHITWNRLDNRKSMLNICKQTENAKNGSAGYLFGKKRRGSPAGGAHLDLVIS
jgi:hypothetical protein